MEHDRRKGRDACYDLLLVRLSPVPLPPSPRSSHPSHRPCDLATSHRPSPNTPKQRQSSLSSTSAVPEVATPLSDDFGVPETVESCSQQAHRKLVGTIPRVTANHLGARSGRREGVERHHLVGGSPGTPNDHEVKSPSRERNTVQKGGGLLRGPLRGSKQAHSVVEASCRTSVSRRRRSLEGQGARS